MDDGYYIDDWGEPRKKEDLGDWSEFEPWQFWQTQFEWIDTVDDIQDHDVIAFRDDVINYNRDGSRTIKNAARFNICRVANIKDSRVYMEVIHSEGVEAIEAQELIHRAIEWLCRYGVKRWPRERSPTDRVTPKQREKGKTLKEERDSHQVSGKTTRGGKSISKTFNRLKSGFRQRKPKSTTTKNRLLKP